MDDKIRDLWIESHKHQELVANKLNATRPGEIHRCRRTAEISAGCGWQVKEQVTLDRVRVKRGRYAGQLGAQSDSRMQLQYSGTNDKAQLSREQQHVSIDRDCCTYRSPHQTSPKLSLTRNTFLVTFIHFIVS